MNIKNSYSFFSRASGIILQLVAIISAILIIIGWITKVFQWGNNGRFAQFFIWIQANSIILWLVANTAVLLVVLLWTRNLHIKFTKGFSDSFRGNLYDNWDFTGSWRIPDPGILLVTGPDEGGGITKLGTYWENYTFTFTAQISNGCIGVIVRALDLNNYYMFQIRPDKIRPHRRVTIPVIPPTANEAPQMNGFRSVQSVQYLVAWQSEDNSPEFSSTPISPILEGEFKVKIVVKGQSVKIYINDSLIYHRDALLQIPSGKVGFRNHGQEEAYVKDMKVMLN